MAERRPLSTAAIVAITVGSIVLVYAGLLAVFIAGSLYRPETARFGHAEMTPSCSMSGDMVTLAVPLGTPDPEYGEYEYDTVSPARMSGLKYVAVDTVPVPSKAESDTSADRHVLALSTADAVVLTLQRSQKKATLDGVVVEWSWGETGGKQTLPVTLRVDESGCTVR
jgi:hypothetical protein